LVEILKKIPEPQNNAEAPGKNTWAIALFLRLESRCTSLRGIGMEGVAF
jgi:hypothetical protein